MKKLASILVAGLMVVMFASCSAGDDAAFTSINDIPETVDNTKVFMFKDVATHEKVSGAYAIKIKTVNGIKYCALLGAGSEAFFPLFKKPGQKKPAFETYPTSIPMDNGIDIVWVVTWDNNLFLMKNGKDYYQGEYLYEEDMLHCTYLEM